MISKLSIHNYALIRQLEIEPSHTFNVITGETGAGKSIMLGAIGLLLGNRADVKSLLNDENKCVVEGEFELGALGLEGLFEELDVDYDEQTILRREISPKGKSRAFINDQPVTLDVIKAIGQRLVDIHSQNESITLSDKGVKLAMVDAYAQTKVLLLDYQEAYRSHTALNKKLMKLLDQQSNANADRDYKCFLLDELVKSDLEQGELEQLEEEHRVLENAEEIKTKLFQITGEFEESEFPIGDRLKQAVVTLRSMSSFSAEIEGLAERLDSAAMEILDVIGDVSAIQERIEHDPERMAKAADRIDLLQRLLQKHQVATVEQLIAIKQELESETAATENLAEAIENLRRELDQSAKQVLTLAEKLSEERRMIFDELSNGVSKLLMQVGMPEGRLELAYKRVAPWSMGIDDVEFLFSANKGYSLEPVSKVASGGEFSRLMFCLKYMMAQKTAMPTVIFDEIDTGVSGEVALKMGEMMKRMSTQHQIISISHLPQVAAKGDAHYFVYKDNSEATTVSLIKKLDESSRLEEIAKMIGGDRPSETARSSAKELIGING